MKTLLLFLLTLPSFLGFTQSKITSIKMERSRCFGKCPAYTIEIKSNGQVLFIGEENARFDGKIRGQLLPGEWTKIIMKYKQYNYLKLPDSYKNKTSDVSKITLTLTVNGVKKSIRNAHEGPEYLQAMARDINALLSKKINWNKKSFIPNVRFTPPVFLEEDASTQSEIQTDQLGVDEGPVQAEVYEAKQPEVFNFVEKMPEFPGGQSSLTAFLTKNIRYPELARDNGIQGKVICSFVVDKEGSIQNIKVIRGIGGGCDQEAIRVLKMMPKWTPGKQQGKSVNVHYNLPILFKLQ